MHLTPLNRISRDVAKMLATALLLVASLCMSAFAQDKPAPLVPLIPFYTCHMTYALCTYSPCDKPEVKVGKDGKQETISVCHCPVISGGWSAGANDCETDKPTETHVKSRYFPIKWYQRCTNKRPWAMCLDSDCTVDPNDKTKANCTCSVKADQGDYVVMPDSPANPSQCDTGVVSSATVDNVVQITDFLENQDNMPVYDILVVNPQKQQQPKK
jgi:hypothetical protein